MGPRWETVYDADELKSQISQLATSDTLPEAFFSHRDERPGLFQGDVLQFECGLPVIADDLQPGVWEDYRYWLVIGNTCDFDRDMEDVAWTQLVPLVDVGATDEVDTELLKKLRRYSQSRVFYVPPWNSTDRHHAADFLLPVAVHKAGVTAATRVARLSRVGWFLLHSCIVRFLARTDGRDD